MNSLFFLTFIAAANALSREAILKPFSEGKALKIISGLNNFDSELVRNVAWAAENGGASHIDIACREDLVRAAKAVSTIPVCVSSVTPQDFVAAVQAGADMIEIGNFDSFYDQGIKFTAEDILAMTRKTRALLPKIPLSVTVPHTLSLAEQVSLAIELERCGADILQTEGKMVASTVGLGIQEMIELAAPTLSSAIALSNAVNIPVMSASGLNDVTAPLALAGGARGVGIGSMVNKLKTRQQMLLAVTLIAESMGRTPKNVGAIAADDLEFAAPQNAVDINSALSQKHSNV